MSWVFLVMLWETELSYVAGHEEEIRECRKMIRDWKEGGQREVRGKESRLPTLQFCLGPLLDPALEKFHLR